MARARATTQAVRVGTARVGGGRARRIGGYAGRTETSSRGGLSDAALDANNRGSGGKGAPGTGLSGGAGGTALPSGVVAETKGPGGTPIGVKPKPITPSAPTIPTTGTYTKGTPAAAKTAVRSVGTGKKPVARKVTGGAKAAVRKVGPSASRAGGQIGTAITKTRQPSPTQAANASSRSSSAARRKAATMTVKKKATGTGPYSNRAI